MKPHKKGNFKIKWKEHYPTLHLLCHLSLALEALDDANLIKLKKKKSLSRDKSVYDFQ